MGRTLLIVAAVLFAGVGALVIYAVIDTQKEHPSSPEFFAWALGVDALHVDEIANCTTASWSDRDSADFYVAQLPETRVSPPTSGYPKKLPFQASWAMVEWKRGPAPDSDQRILKEGADFAVAWLGQEGGCPSVRDMLLSMPTITDRADIWYSYAFKDDPWLNRFSLYVIDPSANVFYLLRFGIRNFALDEAARERAPVSSDVRRHNLAIHEGFEGSRRDTPTLALADESE